MHCSTCGEPLDPAETRCPACGALASDNDEIWRAARAADAPTQVFPAVPPVEAAAALQPEPAEPVHAAAPPPQITPPPAADWADQGAIAVPAPQRRMPQLSREVVLAAVAGTLVVLALLGVVLSRGVPAGNPTNAGVATDAPTGSADSGASATPAGEPLAGFSCERREIAASQSGRWRLFRAEYGPRGEFDYLRLQLRRAGDNDQAASMIAELVPVADVAERYEVAAPAGDAALVVTFNGPVEIGGGWGANPNYPGLREFRVTRGREGLVYVVAGVGGRGCYALDGGGWDSGEIAETTDITLELQRP